MISAKTKRTAAVLLAFLLTVLPLASCSSPNPENEAPSEPSAVSPAEAEAAPEEPEITRENMPDTLPDDLDFGGESFTIYYSNGFNWTAFIEGGEELTGETVSDIPKVKVQNAPTHVNMR